MNGRTGSWWGWVLLLFVVVAVFAGDGRIPLLPFIIGAIILSKVFQKRSGVSGPSGRRQVGHGGAGGHQHGHTPSGRAAPTSPPQDSPMPTIDVPRYPGDGPVPGPPSTPYGDLAGPPGSPPPPRSEGAGGPAPAAGAPHTSTDPVVSLGQLHLSRCGRDLQAATQHGTVADLARVLDEIRDLSGRMQDMLGAAAGTPGSGRREFQAGLRAIDRLVEDARGEHPPGAKLTRLTQACLRMGQTGRHE